MPFLVICKDSSAASELRKDWMQEHLDYVENALDDFCVAGPISTKKNDTFDGSCFIYNTDDIKTAEALFFNDPYYINGVYNSYEFSKFLPAAGNWIGGKIW